MKLASSSISVYEQTIQNIERWVIPKSFLKQGIKDFDTCYQSRTWVLPLLPYQAITHICLEKDVIQLKLALNCIQEYTILRLWNQQYSPTTMELWSCAPFNNVALDFGTIWHTVSATYYCDWKRQDTKINQDEASIRLHFHTDTRERRTRLKWSRN